MKLRKIYNLKHKSSGKTYHYTTIHCPDTELEIGQTTKLTHECRPCENYKGILDDESGKYVKCEFKKIAGLIDDVDTKFYVSKKLMRALNHFGIHPNEFDGGLRHVKNLAKKGYKEKLFKYHPDTTRIRPEKANRKLRTLRNMFDKIDDLKLVPPTENTLDTYLELHGKYNTEVSI